MNLHTPYQSIRETDYTVSINPGNSEPFAAIEMGDDCNVKLTGSYADMRRLLKASATVVAMFEAQSKPHKAERGAGPHGAHCQVCGLLSYRHAEPEPVLEGTVTAPPQDAPYAEAICGIALDRSQSITCGLKPGHDGDYHLCETGEVRYRWPRQASEFADETATAGAR